MENVYISTQANSKVKLITELADGGEGIIYQINLPGKLAKIYKNNKIQNLQTKTKIEYLIQQKPIRIDNSKFILENANIDTSTLSEHISYAWPESTLTNINGDFVGFIMPEIPDHYKLTSIHTPLKRVQENINFNWKKLLILARNISVLVKTLHFNNIIVGDVSLANILINKHTGLPTIIDVDSFQVYDSTTNTFFHCNVGTQDFIPPELRREMSLGNSLSEINQNKSHDYFRLGILFHILMFGYHPFQSAMVWDGTNPPDDNTCLEKGFWPFTPLERYLESGFNGRYNLKKGTPSIQLLNPILKENFLNCFNIGFINPVERPSTVQWIKSIDNSIEHLVQCNFEDSHWYLPTFHNCWWCELENDDVQLFAKITSFDRLIKLLSLKQWKSADLETKLILIKLSSERDILQLTEKSMMNIPSSKLLEIDKLWSRASDNHFGFRSQFDIFRRTGNIIGQYNWKNYFLFGCQVDWASNTNRWKNYNELNFSSSAPKGHLPFLNSGLFCILDLIFQKLYSNSI